MKHAQTWSQLQAQPRRYPVRRVDDGFKYHEAQTHADAAAFKKRMAEYARKARKSA